MLLNSLTNIFESLTQCLEAYFRDPVFNNWKQCGIRENAKIPDVIRYLIASGEDWPKSWHGMWNWERKRYSGQRLQSQYRLKFRMRACREKGARMRVQEPPFQALSTPSWEDVSEEVSVLEICLKFRLHTYIPTYVHSKHLKTKINIYKEYFEKGV